MKILATKTYLTEFSRLSKKKKGLYSKVKIDVENWFKAHNTFELIWESNYALRDSGVARIIKVRIVNSTTNKGSSAGYRLIIVCNKVTKSIGLLYIFPKTGPLGKSNIDEDLEKKIISRFSEENNQGTLQRLEYLEKLMKEGLNMNKS